MNHPPQINYLLDSPFFVYNGNYNRNRSRVSRAKVEIKILAI